MHTPQFAQLINGKRLVNGSLQFAVMVVLLLLISARAQADVVRVFEEKVGPVPELAVPLKAGETVTLETRNLSPGVDPVLHLWDPINQVEIAMDDNGGGGKSAKLRKLITRTENYLLIVRPRNFLSAGTTDIFKNGVLLRRQVKVEGWYVFLLSLQAKEQISVLPPPQGAPVHMMYLISEDGLHLERRQRGAPRSQWEAPEGIFGARTMLIGVRPEEAGKPMRLYRNDVKLSGADPDHDGLGTGLERQLQTCTVASDSLGAFLCDSDHVADMRDSDGDGISDGWEVLGRDFGDVYVPLPTWGSNPRHKDLFIEADYRRLNADENRHAPQHMPPAVAIAFSRAYGDDNTTNGLDRILHANLVGNPDQLAGISTHIDTGVKPEKPEDAGIYGDWGGYEAIDAVKNEDGDIAGQDPGVLWKTHMHPSRRGIFRYGPGHETGGGSCGVGVVYCGYDFNDVGNAVHEIMHTLGVNHSGPEGIETRGANCKPNYPSAVNYAYKDDVKEKDVVLAKGTLLSDGRDRPTLNNTALREFNAVPPVNTTYINDLRVRFQYLVDPVNGHVDWNRDGIFAPAGQTVRAQANYAPGNSCEGTRVNQVEFGTEATSVALTQLGGNHTLLFYRDPAGEVKMRESKSDWDCAPAEKNCSGSSFGGTQSISFGIPVLSIDAEPVVVDGREEVSLIAIGRDGLIRERKFSLSGSGELTLSPGVTVINSTVPAAGQPSLARTRDGLGIYLIYKGTDHALRWRLRKSNFWGVENLALDSSGRRLLVATEASPAIVSAYLPPTAGNSRIYLAFSDRTLKLQLYSLNAEARWEASNLLASQPAKSVGRPAMAWVPTFKQRDTPGQLYLTFRNKKKTYRMMRTYYDLKSNSIRVGLSAYFDNVWSDGEGMDVMTSATTGQPQLWAVLTHKRKDEDLILFRPRADGIVDIKQINYDDWTATGWGLCEYVVNPDDTVSSPIHCKKRPWRSA